MLPAKLVEKLRKPKPPKRTGDGGEITPEQLGLLLSALDPHDYGAGGPHHGDWAKVMAACHDATNGDGVEEWLDWAARDERYSGEDANRNRYRWGTFTAGKAGGATLGTLRQAVEMAGRLDIIRKVFGADDFDDDVIADDFPDVSVAVEDAATWFEEHFQRIGQCDIASILPTPWLTPGLLLYGEVTLVGGRGGVGKSLHAWQIAVATALGIPFAWWPAPERSRRVLVLSGEDDADEIERRVAAACQALKVDRSALGDNFLVWKQRDIRIATKDQRTGALTRTKLWKMVRWAIERRDVGLVIIDPLIKASSGFKESDNDDMEELLLTIRELIAGHDCAALVDDHFAKGGIGGDQAGIRGASSKVDAARITITLTQMTEKEWKRLRPPCNVERYVRFHDPKQNYGPKKGAQWLQLVDYAVGNGETRPAMHAVDLLTGEDFLDPGAWEHRGAFLRLVMQGREEASQAGWPWCSAIKGPKDSRLDSAVAEMFGLTIRQARAWIDAFASEGSIREEDWTSPTRNSTGVWRINIEYEEPTE